MKTAVIMSGHMRSFEICYPNQRWMVYRHYPGLEFFVSCHDDGQSHTADLLRNDFDNVHIERVREPNDLPVMPVSSAFGTPFQCSVTPTSVVSQYWIGKRAWNFFVEQTKGEHYGTIIRMRPDLYFHRYTPPPRPQLDECYAPWWGRFGGMNDRFAVMGYTAAEHYFNMFNALPILLKKGCPFHPESILSAAMEDARVRVYNTLLAECSTIRLDGKNRAPELLIADALEFIVNHARETRTPTPRIL